MIIAESQAHLEKGIRLLMLTMTITTTTMMMMLLLLMLLIVVMMMMRRPSPQSRRSLWSRLERTASSKR